MTTPPPTAPTPSTQPSPPAGFGVTQIELEIPIRATPERVWRALVVETAAWWSKDFYTAPAERPSPRMVIEPRLGGRMYEDWGDGAGAMWYTVTAIDPPRSLGLLGHLSAAYGGPAMTMLSLALAPSATGTALKLSDTIFGRIGDGGGGSTREGWMALLDQGLRVYAEDAARG